MGTKIKTPKKSLGQRLTHKKNPMRNFSTLKYNQKLLMIIRINKDLVQIECSGLFIRHTFCNNQERIN